MGVAWLRSLSSSTSPQTLLRSFLLNIVFSSTLFFSKVLQEGETRTVLFVCLILPFPSLPENP